jgi:hypothetical protein
MRITKPSCVLGDGVGGLSLKEYDKVLAEFSFLVNKGFP